MCVNVPVAPVPHVTVNVPAPVPVTVLAVKANVEPVTVPPETVMLWSPAPATVYICDDDAHGFPPPIPAPVISKSPAAGEAVTVTFVVAAFWQP